ncbi:MAG TPA: hypothetical protein H9803_07835 [Candidatus Ligilactobacillus excrementavium]|nr:hypothetical protein [Candidatus Ligilactobacillus excrementavium]
MKNKDVTVWLKSFEKRLRESETKDVLKSICNDDCVILGRSEAKNQNNAIVVTVRLQSFGTHLRAVDLTR